jgi:hypothetical protein
MTPMRRFGVSLALSIAAVLAVGASARAFSLAALLNGGAYADKFKIIHVSDLSRMMKDTSTKVWVYDADPADERGHYGVIPGAHLLSSDNDYDVNTELPHDKNAKLVFYCANYH